MLNEKRIKQMSKLAICEERMKRNNVRIHSYYYSDYTRLQVLKTMVAVTIAYWICILGLIVFRLEYLLEHWMDIPYKKYIVMILVLYLAVLVIFFIVSRVLAHKKYKRIECDVKEYYNILNELDRCYEEEKRNDSVINDSRDNKKLV